MSYSVSLHFFDSHQNLNKENSKMNLIFLSLSQNVCLVDFKLEAWVWGLITSLPFYWNILLTWTSIRWNSSKQLHAPHEASPLRNLAKALYWKSSEQLNPTHCLATALAKSLTVSVFPVAVSPQTKPPCNDEKTKCYKWFKIQRKFRSLSYVWAAFAKEYVQSFQNKAHY